MMGLFSFFNGSDNNDKQMPMGMALDMLEEVSKLFPHLAIEWIDANPQRAQKIDGPVDKKICKQYRNWDGPYSITIRSGEDKPCVINMFFQDLRRDIKVMHDAVIHVGKAEGEAIQIVVDGCRSGIDDEDTLIKAVLDREVRSDYASAKKFVDGIVEAFNAGCFEDLQHNEDREYVDDNIQMIDLLALMSISGKMLDKFPSILNTPSQYDSKSIVLAGMLSYYGILLVLNGASHTIVTDMYQKADKNREKERRLNRADFVPIDFFDLTNNLLVNLQPRMDSLQTRAEKHDVEVYKILALDIADWIVINLTQGRCDANEKNECARFFANNMISSIAFEMCGLNGENKA